MIFFVIFSALLVGILHRFVSNNKKDNVVILFSVLGWNGYLLDLALEKLKILTRWVKSNGKLSVGFIVHTGYR